MAANSEAEVSDQIQDILSLCSNEQVFDSRKKSTLALISLYSFILK